MNWQPIEAAPRDGTPILAWDGRDRMVVEFYERRDGSAMWRLADTRDGETMVACAYPLTHWQPLPEPPA